MSDREHATEQATPERLQQMRKKGEVPVYKEVNTATSVALLALFLSVGAPLIGRQIATAFKVQLASLGDSVQITPMTEFGGVLGAASQGLRIWVVIAGIIIAATSFVAGSACFSLDRISIKAERLNVFAGMSRLLNVDSLINIGRSTLVASAVISAAYVVLQSDKLRILSLADLAPVSIAAVGARHLTRFALAASIVLTAVAVIDVLVVRFRFLQRARMTREEIKQEHKEHEGDPLIRGRRRRRHRELMRGALTTTVPDANMIIANPTHIAIALRYRQGIDPAPVVVAKGVDQVALRIRRIATQHGIPVVENRPLARSLLRRTRLGDSVPSDLYRAVAEVIAFLVKRGSYKQHKLPMNTHQQRVRMGGRAA